MPRIRTVKPEFWTDAKIVELSPLARLLFIGSWNFADDYGCLSPSAKQLKIQVLPAEIEDAEKLIEELFEARLLERLVTPNGREFWHIANWSKHQRVNRPSDSEYGDPTTWKPAPTRGFSEDSVSAPVYSLNVHEGREGKGREGNGKEVALHERASTRNEIWETLVSIYGEPTPPQRSLYGRVTKFLTEQDATPNDIQLRAQALVAKWGPDTNTLTALEKHWNFLASPAGTLTEDRVEAYHDEMQRQRRLAELEAIDNERSLER